MRALSKLTGPAEEPKDAFAEFNAEPEGAAEAPPERDWLSEFSDEQPTRANGRPASAPSERSGDKGRPRNGV
jgi:hypothetical protein